MKSADLLIKLTLVQNANITDGDNVLVRADLNLGRADEADGGGFKDYYRLEQSIPTINYLLDNGARVFIISHLGQPKGDYEDRIAEKENSFKDLVPILADELGAEVLFIKNFFSDKTQKELRNSSAKVVLIENLRMWPAEEEGDVEFAKSLVANLGINKFVQDGFGVLHRKHASVVCIPKIIQSSAGLLVQKEIEGLEIKKSEKNLFIIGGAKVESKLTVISSVVGPSKNVLTGGVVANTLLKADGKKTALSLVDLDYISVAKKILQKNKEGKIVLPTDYLCGTALDVDSSEGKTQKELDGREMILDIGPETTAEYISKIVDLDFVFWAGTLGYTENKVFAEGSDKVLKALIKFKRLNPKVRIAIGGGDTVDFVRSKLSKEELRLLFISTGGGAGLGLLSGKELPGIEALIAGDRVMTTSATKAQPVASSARVDKAKTLGENTPVLIANLKAHFKLDEMKVWVNSVLREESLISPGIRLMIAPPDIFLEEIKSQIDKQVLRSAPELIAQDVSSHNEGAYTGQVSASMLQGIVKGSLVGHSETRKGGLVEKESILQKINRLIEQKMVVVLCVGGDNPELVAQRRQVFNQLKSALKNLSLDNSNLLIAYEPVFAIGGGGVPNTEFLKRQIESIKEVLNDLGFEADLPKILYGGSVDSKNVNSVMGCGFEGVLVGSASIKVDGLTAIAKGML